MREDSNSVSKRRSRSQSAFTLIEAVVSIGIVGIGVASAMGGFSALTKTDVSLRDREYQQRLAVQKYDEIISTGAIDTAELNGDFTDRNDNKYEWRAEVTPSGVDNLQVLTVTVKAMNTEEGPQAVVDGLVFQPPQNTGGTTP